MDNFAEALRAVASLKREGVITDYAVGGAMAIIFWSEPTATFDLDVFVTLGTHGPLVSLDPIYAWARQNRYPEVDEHIVISGLPVQLIPAPNALAEEAIATAAELEYEGASVRVIRPEYLVAMYLEPAARTQKRLARAAALLDEGILDRDLLNNLLQRHNLQLPHR